MNSNKNEFCAIPEVDEHAQARYVRKRVNMVLAAEDVSHNK